MNGISRIKLRTHHKETAQNASKRNLGVRVNSAFSVGTRMLQIDSKNILIFQANLTL